MPDYIVRVELHGATSADYTKLHSDMKAAGFSQTIRGSDRVDYALPTAEYTATTSKDAAGVCEVAYTVAARIRLNPSVVSSEYKSVVWKGLSPA